MGNNFPFAAKRIPSEPRYRARVKIKYTPPEKFFVQQITYYTGFLPPVLFDSACTFRLIFVVNLVLKGPTVFCDTKYIHVGFNPTDFPLNFHNFWCTHPSNDFCTP